MAYFKQLCLKELLIFMQICPPTEQIKKRKFFHEFANFLFLLVLRILAPKLSYLAISGPAFLKNDDIWSDDLSYQTLAANTGSPRGAEGRAGGPPGPEAS